MTAMILGVCAERVRLNSGAVTRAPCQLMLKLHRVTHEVKPVTKLYPKLMRKLPFLTVKPAVTTIHSHAAVVKLKKAKKRF